MGKPFDARVHMNNRTHTDYTYTEEMIRTTHTYYYDHNYMYKDN